MFNVPNVHIRDVPLDALDALRAAAERHGRSLNSELVEVLVGAATREATEHALRQRIEEIRRRFDERGGRYPDGLEPEAIIREARDAR